jgi:hypothetical protein
LTVEIIDEPTHNHHQSKWVTRMARHACRHDPKWIVHIDADEFWYGLECLHNPERFKGVGTITVQKEFHHVATAGLVFGQFRRDQMPYCRRVRRPMPKIIHKAAPNVHIFHGNHIASHVPGRHAGAPKDIYIHHFPVRSYGHFEAKTIKGGRALNKHPGPWSNGKRWRGWYKTWKAGELPALYEEKHLYSPEKIAAGLADGSLVMHIPEEYAHV